MSIDTRPQKNKPRVIGITGQIGSGKNTAANILRNIIGKADSSEMAFADTLKQMVATMCGIRPVHLSNQEFKKTISPVEIQGEQVTYRRLLQFFGTECMRQLDPNIHVNLLRNKLILCPGFKTIIITDVRFDNEARMIIEEYSGHIIQLKRDETDNPITEDTHESERGLTPSNAIYTIVNNGTLADLEEDLREFYNSLPTR